MLRGVAGTHVVALEIAEQPYRIAAERFVVLKRRPTHRARKVDRRQSVDLDDGALEHHHRPVAVRAAERHGTARGHARNRRRSSSSAAQQARRGRLRAGDPAREARRSAVRAGQDALPWPARAATELVAHTVAVGIAGVFPGTRSLASLGDEIVGLNAQVNLQRFGREAGDVGARTLPPERLDDEIVVDAVETRRIRSHRRLPTRSTPKSTPLLVSRASRACAVARSVAEERVALPLEIDASSRAQAPARPRAQPTPASSARRRWRGVLPSPSRNALSVSAPAPFGPADPVARRARDRLRAAEQTFVHATERPLRGVRRVAAAEPVGEAELVLEQELPFGQLRQTGDSDRQRSRRRLRDSRRGPTSRSHAGSAPGAAASRRRSS